MGEADDIIPLGFCGITWTCASHVLEITNKEFKFDPIIAQFNSKDMRVAVLVI
jgi:hypothetical protein